MVLSAYDTQLYIDVCNAVEEVIAKYEPKAKNRLEVIAFMKHHLDLASKTIKEYERVDNE